MCANIVSDEDRPVYMIENENNEFGADLGAPRIGILFRGQRGTASGGLKGFRTLIWTPLHRVEIFVRAGWYY